MKDYYKILGISPYAEISEISAAYRALAQIYHPDKWKGDKRLVITKLEKLTKLTTFLKIKIKSKNMTKSILLQKKINQNKRTLPSKITNRTKTLLMY